MVEVNINERELHVSTPYYEFMKKPRTHFMLDSLTEKRAEKLCTKLETDMYSATVHSLVRCKKYSRLELTFFEGKTL